MLDAHTCILNVSHRLREIHKADRLNFKIVPNRHQATDFYQIKIELYKQIRYGTDVTGFGGVYQVIDMSTLFSWRRCYFINARISKLESNCDEAKLKIFMQQLDIPVIVICNFFTKEYLSKISGVCHFSPFVFCILFGIIKQI